jgi:acetylornithine deacetylase
LAGPHRRVARIAGRGLAVLPALRMNPVTLARSLVEIASPTGEEAAVVLHMATILRNLDLRVEQQQVAPNRFNLLATTTAPPRVVFSTHLDTVPGTLEVREDETHLYGRGACDAKGVAAAQLAAAARLLDAGEHRIGLLFTIDEEMDSLGAREANDHPMAEQCAYIINGEPTNNQLATGTKGSLRLRLRAKGKEAHSAYPEHGESAILRLIDAIALLRAEPWPSHERFGDTTLNVGVIKGGTRPNVIPGAAHADLQFRLVAPAAETEARVRTLVGGLVEIDVLSASDPLSLHTVEGFDTSPMRFTTDLPYLDKWGTPLLLGPGSILVAHTDEERISKKELKAGADLYVRLANELLARYDAQEAEEAAREEAT